MAEKPIWSVQPPCEDCYAACCKKRPTQPDYAVILQPQDDPSKFQTMKTPDGLAVPYADNGDCVYLKDDRCSIYADRPSRCREFNCVWHYGVTRSDGKKYTQFLEDSPRVLRLIQIALRAP